MALNMVDLMRALGTAGIIGQSFANDVPGAGNNVGVLDYRVTAMEFTGSLPVSSSELPGAYPSGQSFTFNVAMTRGNQAYRLQYKTQSAFTLQLVQSLPGLSASITGFTMNNDGGDFDITMQFLGAFNGTYTINAAAQGAMPPNWGDDWNWTFTAVPGSASGNDEVEAYLTYDVDSAFNPNLSNISTPWDFAITRRSYNNSDVSFRWWNNSTDANNNDPNTTIAAGDGVATVYGVSKGNGHPNNVNEQVWMRWRPVAGGSWSSVVGPASITGDTRLES